MSCAVASPPGPLFLWNTGDSQQGKDGGDKRKKLQLFILLFSLLLLCVLLLRVADVKRSIHQGRPR